MGRRTEKKEAERGREGRKEGRRKGRWEERKQEWKEGDQPLPIFPQLYTNKGKNAV